MSDTTEPAMPSPAPQRNPWLDTTEGREWLAFALATPEEQERVENEFLRLARILDPQATRVILEDDETGAGQRWRLHNPSNP